MSIKDFFVGKKIMQPLFERLYRISLRGMNYGLGGMIESSGEINLVKLIANQLINSEGKKVIFDIGANNGKYTDILLK
ncbi:hypothetical protein LVD15_05000 [Fulvivirga maritima]|uniref:hypothetical protein n=1 Tax=Fulvivirga maritima TaxID=2904247 RepID=UPI001F29E370|nr:hypothetical protein [Fulvivirga maritima]UII27782.1 hypothetical protein LVD15_05000 [Fulvivirga maritima]